MSNPFIPNLTNKSSPVANDLLIIADSQDSNLEKNTTIGQVIISRDLVAASGVITSGNMPALDDDNTIVDSGIVAEDVISVGGTFDELNLPVTGPGNTLKSSGIAIDTSRNLTNVGSINGITVTNLLVKTNNLSDVSNRQTAFKNVAPATPILGDIIYYDGSNWVKLSIGSTNYILTVSAGSIPTWTSPGTTSGFAENAVFKGNASGSLTGGLTPTNISLGAIDSASTGNTWTLQGDGFGMKCGTAGYYSFTVTIPYMVSSLSSFGIIWSQLTKNGTPIGPISPLNPITGAGNPIYQANLTAIISCSVNDVIRLTGACGATLSPIIFYDASLGTGANVLITRLT